MWIVDVDNHSAYFLKTIDIVEPKRWYSWISVYFFQEIDVMEENSLFLQIFEFNVQIKYQLLQFSREMVLGKTMTPLKFIYLFLG